MLELGSGCGLPGLAAWRAGASAVWLTDLPENVARLREVTQHNHGASGCVRVEPLDWTQPLPPAIVQTRFDLVLGADIVFWPALFDPLLTVLAGLNGSPRILLAIANRLGRGDDFERRAASHGWRLHDLPVQSDASDDARQERVEPLREPPPRLVEMLSLRRATATTHGEPE